MIDRLEQIFILFHRSVALYNPIEPRRLSYMQKLLFIEIALSLSFHPMR